MGVSGKPSGPTIGLEFLHSYTFRIHSIHVHPTKHPTFVKSYTFLYAPCNPFTILANCLTSLCAPFTFHIQNGRVVSKVVRCYMFRATLFQFLQIYMHDPTLTPPAAAQKLHTDSAAVCSSCCSKLIRNNVVVLVLLVLVIVVVPSSRNTRRA